MSASTEDRNQLISLVVGMFDATPTSELVNAWLSDITGGDTLSNIAENLTNTNEFASIYSPDLTDEAFATLFATNILSGQASEDGLAAGIEAVRDLLAAGHSRAETCQIAVDFLMELETTDPTFGLAAQTLRNKTTVASYFVDAIIDAPIDLEYLQAAVSDVDSTQSSVENKLALISINIDEPDDDFFLTWSGGNEDFLDNITGTAADESFVSYIFDNNNTLESHDSIDGGLGRDTLIAELVNNRYSPVKATVTSIETIHFRAHPNTIAENVHPLIHKYSVQAGQQVDASNISGTLEFGSIDSGASLKIKNIQTASAETTLRWQGGDSEDASFTAYFETISVPVNPITQLQFELLEPELSIDEYMPLLNNFYSGILLSFNNRETYISWDSYVQSSYEDLLVKMNAAIGRQGITELNASLGQEFTIINPDDGKIYYGTSFILAYSGHEEITIGGWTVSNIFLVDTFHTAAFALDSTSINTKTQTNAIFDNVGSDGKAGNFIAGSEEDNAGIQRFNIQVDRDSWVNEIKSTNQSLEEVYLSSIGANGSVQIDELNDIRTFDATAMQNEVILTASLGENVGEDESDIVDKYFSENTDILFTYQTGIGNDIIQINLSEQFVSQEQFLLEINTNAGNDLVVLSQSSPVTISAEQANTITIETGSGQDTLALEGYHDRAILVSNFNPNAYDSDNLDLSSYLSDETAMLNYDQRQSNLSSALTLTNNNSFTEIVGVDSALTADETWDGLTATVLLAAIQNTNQGSNDYLGFSASTLDINIEDNGIDDFSQHIIAIENDSNAGEYKLFHLTADISSQEFETAHLIGILDFGDSIQMDVITGNT